MKSERGERMANSIQEFSRFAHQYDHYNVIQAQVAKTLVETLSESNYNTILDVGCGSGEVFRNIQKREIKVDHFIALDSSENMLTLHPQMQNTIKVCTDFNNKNFIDTLPFKQYDLVISSSALQWSNDLNFTLETLSQVSDKMKAAIFTSGTFKTLHQVAQIESPIYTAEEIQEIVLKHYKDVSFVRHHYTLDFGSVREMFRYIKKSGVSGGKKQLSYKETKQLMRAYPLNHLEFEVLFVEATSLA
jgi:malonyl-CoA O-methyltransferase